MSRPAYIAGLQEGWFQPLPAIRTEVRQRWPVHAAALLGSGGPLGGGSLQWVPLRLDRVTDQVRLPNHGSRSAEPALQHARGRLADRPKGTDATAFNPHPLGGGLLNV